MAIKPCTPCVTLAMDEALDRATVKVKEKTPERLAAEGKADEAERVAKAMLKRSKYTPDKADAMNEQEFMEFLDAEELTPGGAGAPGPGGGLPPEFTIPKYVTQATILDARDLAIKGYFARYIPMRQVFGKPAQEQLWHAHDEMQVTMMRLAAKVMKGHMDANVIPARWWSAGRPNMRLADEDSMRQVLGHAFTHRLPPGYDPFGVGPTRTLRPAEAKLGVELSQMIDALGAQTNVGTMKFFKNYLKAQRPLESHAFMAALIRQAAADRIMKPTIVGVEKGLGLGAGSKHPMTSLWQEWKGYLLGRPTPTERQMSITWNRMGQAIAKIPGPVGRAFAGRENPRSALAFSEMITSWYYAGGMGLRPSSALHNVFDASHGASEIGIKWLGKGFMYRAANGLDEAAKGKVLTSSAEALTSEEQQLIGGSASSTLAHYFLFMFRKVDVETRAGIYYGAKLKFQHYLANGTIDRLIEGKGLVTGMKKDMRASIRYMIKNDMVEDAMEMYARDSAHNAVYVYGRGNSPMSMQSPVGKMVGMFSQWPLNYTQFLRGMTEDGRRSAFLAHVASVGALIYAGGAVFDMNVSDWLGAGSMPGEVGVSGPAIKTLLFGANAALSGSKILQAEALGGRYADDKSIEFEKRQFNESMRQLGNTAAGISIPAAGAIRDVYKAIKTGSFSPIFMPSGAFEEPGRAKEGRQPRKARSGGPKRMFLDEGLEEMFE